MLDIRSKYKKSLSRFRFIDLFCGIGGFRLALESFGSKCVFSSEWNKPAQDVYETNFGERPSGDITKINENSIPAHDILCAGFPCQAFSISGNQLGFSDTRGTLFFDILRIVKFHSPKILLLENVKNLSRHDNGKTFSLMLKNLTSLGYKVFHEVINASYFGVPQNRERIYIIAIKSSGTICSFQFPLPLNIPITISDIILKDSETLKYIKNRSDLQMNTNISLEKDIFRTYPLKPKQIGKVNKGGQGERIYHEKGHGITLSAYGGGVGSKTGLFLINNKIRKLAPRECARLMGFPESFKIHPSDAQSYKQFGNSIVVNVLQSILLNLTKWK